MIQITLMTRQNVRNSNQQNTFELQAFWTVAYNLKTKTNELFGFEFNSDELSNQE